MESKLQELTTKIYQEGVERARSEGKEIVDKAREEAEALLANARAESERIVANAKNETDQLRQRVLSEVKQAGGQAIAALKQEIVNLVSHAVFASSSKDAFNDVPFVQGLIKDIIGHWNPGKSGQEISLILPEKTKIDMQKFFGAKSQELLTRGVAITFDNRFESGFKIGPKDNSYVLSFSDKEFTLLFQSYLKARTREILFPGA